MTNRDHVSTETLADHAEGLLGESEAGQVQAHLDECEDCRSEALLLVSLQEILRADDPGPMPAEYATRIDAALAELIAAEPPRRLHPEAVPLLNAPAESEAGGAKVIDLASRRAVMMTGLRRVSTVAAGVVLLIGGAALGVQTIGKHTDLVTPPPSAHDAAQPVYTSVPLAPKDAKPGKNGIRIGKDGTIYLKNGKVLLTDGTVIVPGAHKSDPPVVVSPKHKSPGGATTIVPKNTPPKSQTGTQPAKTPPPGHSSGAAGHSGRAGGYSGRQAHHQSVRRWQPAGWRHPRFRARAASQARPARTPTSRSPAASTPRTISPTRSWT